MSILSLPNLLPRVSSLVFVCLFFLFKRLIYKRNGIQLQTCFILNRKETAIKQQIAISLGFTTRDVERTRERLVNHGTEASSLQAFLVFPQHPKCAYYAGNSQKLRCIVFIKQLQVTAIFYQFTGTIDHRLLTNQNACSIQVVY